MTGIRRNEKGASMKPYKRLPALLLALCLLFTTLVTTALPALAADGEQKKETLIMATCADFPPYEYKSGDEIVGIDPAIAKAIADKLGMELKIVDVSFDSVLAGVQTGKYDIGMSGITVNAERKESVAFTSPYTTATQSVIIREGSPYHSIADFYTEDSMGKRITKDGVKIGVQTGTTGQLYADETPANDGFGKENVIKYKTGADAVQALKTKKVEAVILDELPAKSFIAANTGLTLMETSYLTEQYSIAVNKNDTELLGKVNTALEQLIADGTVDQIKTKYISATTTSSNDTASNSWWGNLKKQFNLNFVQGQKYKWLLQGLGRTLLITLFAAILGVIIGVLLAGIRTTWDKNRESLTKQGGFKYGLLKVLDALARLYLTVIRGTPVVVQLLIGYFIIFAASNSDMLIAILVFGMNSGAYVAEIFRSGIMAIDQGQFEAGRSLGFNYFQTMRYVITPQMFKVVLPTLLNEMISLLKETSVAGYVGIMDLTKAGDLIRGQTFSAFLPLIAVALIYLVIVLLFSSLVKRIERRMRSNDR